MLTDKQVNDSLCADDICEDNHNTIKSVSFERRYLTLG